MVVLDDGLMYLVESSGSGRSPKPSDTVRVMYKGMLMDGSVFDETKTGETSVIDLSGAIAGLREALPLMKEGDKWDIVIPSALAYGEAGEGSIPPNMPLALRAPARPSRCKARFSGWAASLARPRRPAIIPALPFGQ